MKKLLLLLPLVLVISCNTTTVSPSLSDVSAIAGKAGTEVTAAHKISDSVYTYGAKPKDVQVAQLRIHLTEATKQLDDLQKKVLPAKQQEIDTLAMKEAEASKSALEAKDLAKKRGKFVWIWFGVSMALVAWITRDLWFSLLVRLIRGGI